MIRDGNGDELTYWPISGVIEGDDTDPLLFTPTTQGQKITATRDDRVVVKCRVAGAGPYTDISNGSLDVSALMLDGSVDFDIYATVMGPIEGLERIPITVTVGSSGPAGWLS